MNSFKLRFMKPMMLSGVLTFCLLLTVFTSCSKDYEESYDPSGKCGSVISSTWSNSGAWLLTVQMDDGYLYKNGVSATQKNLGDRVCF